jgi:hypothetical protein
VAPCYKLAAYRCDTCARLKKLNDKRDRQKAIGQRDIDQMQANHLAEVADLDARIQAEIAEQRKTRLAAEQLRDIEQRHDDLRIQQSRSLSMAAASNSTMPSVTPSIAATSTNPPSSDTPTAADASLAPAPDPRTSPLSASQEWDRMKQFEGQKNSHIDEIMKMVGLEKVKMQFLDVKEDIDLSNRQGSDISVKNLNVALLGNPGTGETPGWFVSASL